MKFISKLSRLFNLLGSEFTRNPKGSELVTVFATDKNDCRNDGTARPNPFMPSNRYSNTSCYRIKGLSTHDIWEISIERVLKLSKKIRKIYGRFDFHAKTIYDQKLLFDPNNKPYRHADIINWPSDKQAQRSRAQQIAAESTFHCEITYLTYIAQIKYDILNKCLIGNVMVDGNDVSFKSKLVNDLPENLKQAIGEQLK